MKAVIFDYNRTIHDPDSGALTSGAKELLDGLKNAGCKLFLVSRSKNEQKRRQKINQLGISAYFEDIQVVPEKTPEVFLSFKDFCPPETQFFVVGDRIKREMRQGNALGMTTIWFRNGKFKDELPEEKVEEPDFTIAELTEALEIIKQQ